jgi:A/G-specific adenine glycosylase
MRRRLWALSEALVPRKHVFDFNQALMDFGATVCTARKPRCEACPMTRSCLSFPQLSSPDTSRGAARVPAARKRA